jgi:MFS family permease
MEGKVHVGQRLVRPPIFYGWYIMLACGVVAFYSWGLGFYGQGVYLQALHTRHGWPTSLISAAITCYYLGRAAVGLIIGGLIDRRDTTPVIAFGVIVMGLGSWP